VGSSDLWGSPKKLGQASDLSFVPFKNKPIGKEIVAWTQIDIVGFSFVCLILV